MVLPAFPPAGPVVLALFLLLTGAAVIDWLVTPAPRVLTVERVAPPKLSVLVKHFVRLRVRNASRVALKLRVRDGMPSTFEPDAAELSGTAPAQGELLLGYEVVPKSRGRFPWGAVHVRYGSLLGFWERSLRAPAAQDSAVYPNLTAIDRYHLLARANRLDLMGIRQVRVRGNAAFESLREYVPGDDVRLMDWKATARRGKLILQNQRTERNQTVLVLLDCGRLMNAEEAGVSKLDHAVNAALLLAHVAQTRGDRVGVCTFSHEVHAWLPPRAGAVHGRQIADLLYDLRGDFTESDHGRCLRLLAVQHPKRALLVVLTDFVDAQTSSEMVAYLREAGRRHLILFVALKDAFLERAAHSRPAVAREGFRKAAAVDLLHERQEVLESLRRTGAHVIDGEPGAVTPPLLNQYLEIAARGLV
jgi:uncharacterized protein (DUF58 family)